MSRFKPVRAGIIGVWDYEEQTFEFADGRLVLRGPNGSGKTKALELLMPFVLDGSIDPRRLDPFSGKDRTMQSNLLYGGDTQRRGYCWMEFRKDDEVVTVGVGLQTDKKRQRPRTWFFVTDRIVGETLHLLNENKIPMTRKAMRQELGEMQWFESRDVHRKAVNHALFGYDGERYDAMIGLILTLRRPHLAKELEPDSLSHVLSEGLRTVDPDQLRSSAAAFDNLESSQRDLSELERANKATEELVTIWRTYLRTRAKVRLDEVDTKAKRVEETNDGIHMLSTEIKRLQTAVDAHKELLNSAKNQVEVHRSHIDALKQRDAYQNQGQLQDAKEVLSLKRQVSEDADKALALCDRRLDEENKTLRKAKEQHRKAQQQVDDTRSALVTHCRAGDVAISEPIEMDAVRIDLTAARSSVADVLEALTVLEAEMALLKTAEADLQQRVAELENAEVDAKKALMALTKAMAERRHDITVWHGALWDHARQLQDLPRLLEAVAAADDVAGDDVAGDDAAGDDAADVQSLVLNAWQRFGEQLVEARKAQQDAIAQHDARLAAIDTEIQTIGAQRDDAPPMPATRRAIREGRAGAPLWRLVRFADDLPADQEAGLEGALLASGLLDAWVDPAADSMCPAAQINRDPDPASERDDTNLRLQPAVTSTSLADVLVAEEQSLISTGHINALLGGISLVDAGVHIAVDGSFALGPLVGAHHPERARYIGATARAEHRAQRIDTLQREHAAEALTRDAAAAEMRRLNRNIEALTQARQTVPPNTAVRRARANVQACAAVATNTTAACAQAQARRDQQKRQRDSVDRDFRRVAARCGLPTDAAKLRALAQHIDDATRVLQTYAQNERLRGELWRTYEDAEQRHGRLIDDQRDRADSANRAQRSHEAEHKRFATLEAGLGSKVKEVHAEIEAATSAQRLAERQAGDAERDREEAAVQAAKRQGKLENLLEQLPEQERDLADVSRRLLPFQRPAIVSTLAIELSDAPFHLRLAHAVASAASSPERLKATETRLHNRLDGLDEALGTRYHHNHRSEDGVIIVRIGDEAGETDVTSFQRSIAERLERVSDLLQESEKKIFEAQLLKSLIARLRLRIAETRALCAHMDSAMRGCKLASGKSLGIRWRVLPDVDPMRRELLDLLKFDPNVSADKLGRMRELLSAEVQLERRENPDRTYMEILKRALDYRSWHRFDLLLVNAIGKEERLTSARHGKLSGGEKAATVHLPLFAAAHAHFKTARPDCPRLIALDEAFAGIDETGTPELLRLAAAFDLDWFLTGHNLWVTEAFLPAVMHYDLAHDETTRAVSAWPILWNGHETIEGTPP